MTETDALLRSLEVFLDGLGVASLCLDHDAGTLGWNQTFLRLFPEQAGGIHQGEPYAENLRRFYRGRLDAAEMPYIETYVSDGLVRHHRQSEPFEFLHRGGWVRAAVLPLPGIGRLRAWTSVRALQQQERTAPQMTHRGARSAPGAPARSTAEAPGLEAADALVLAGWPVIATESIEAFLDSLGIAALTLDEEARTLGWNKGFLHLFPEQAGGIHQGEPYAENLRRFYGTRLDALEMPKLEHYVADGVERHARQVEPFEFLHRGQWLRVAVLPVPGVGRLRAWTSSRAPQDGARLAAQMAHAGKRSGLGAVNQLADGLMVRDASDRIVLANQRFAEVYGLDGPENAFGRTFPELLEASWGDAQGAAVARQRWADNSRFAGAPFELPLPGDRWVRVRDYRSHDGSLVSTHVDVTDLVRLERSATEARRRAEELAAQLRTEMEERKRAEARTVQLARLASLAEMATGLAHEVNQPLTAITLAADRAQLGLKRQGAAAIPAVLERLESIAATTMSARGILDNLRRFAQAEDSAALPVSVDLAEAVHGALGLAEATIRTSGISIETRLPAAPVRVMGQLVGLERVILNLLMNARDAVAAQGGEGGAIRIELAQAGGEALLTVADTGGGFSVAALQRGFEPFFTTKPPGKGTGIGLSVAYSIIQAAGGSMGLSNTDRGALVSVRLPVVGGPESAFPA